MSFIKKDVNLGLLSIIILLSVAIAFLGVYYNQNYNMLSQQYTSQLNNLEKVTEDLLYHKSQLNQTAADLKTIEQDESELSKKYSELRQTNDDLQGENSQLSTELKDKTSDLLAKTNELNTAKNDISNQKSEIAELKTDLDRCETAKASFKNHLDDVCAGDTSVCD